MNVSYAITVKDEIQEIKQLLNFLQPRISPNDEIVVQHDLAGSVEVKNFLSIQETLNTFDNTRIIQYPLNNHFAKFKNNLNKHCKNTYILQLDADEMISEYLINNLHTILERNPGCDLYWLPRVNTVEGITQTRIDRWRWHVNENNWINFPDRQSRLYKRDNKIKWENSVHEQIVGFNRQENLPSDEILFSINPNLQEQFSLIHHKQIDRQIKQNKFYFRLKMLTEKMHKKYSTCELLNYQLTDWIATGKIKTLSYASYENAFIEKYATVSVSDVDIKSENNYLIINNRKILPFDSNTFTVAWPNQNPDLLNNDLRIKMVYDWIMKEDPRSLKDFDERQIYIVGDTVK